MAEYHNTKEIVVTKGDPIIFKNNTDVSFDVSAGIVFHKSGLYDVTVRDKYVAVSKIRSAYDSGSVLDEQTAVKSQPQWIPCSERLPEEKTDVLLAFKNNMVVGFWEDILNDGSVVWYANSGDGWLTQAEADYNDGIPLAWMSLPEPYKEEGE